MPNSTNLAAASDVQLIAATLQGDTSIFGILVQRYWNMTTALALSKIHDAFEAENVAQESFLKAYSITEISRSCPSCRDEAKQTGQDRSQREVISKIARQVC